MNESNTEKKAEELRECIEKFFARAEELQDEEGEAKYGDESDQELYQQILQLLEECEANMGLWEALGDNQVWVLEVIQEGADPALAVEAAYYELSRATQEESNE